MPGFRSPSLILRAYDFSEADRVLVIFTREAGKLRALAKGVRRCQSRLAACSGVITYAELQFHGKEHQELLLLTQGRLGTAYPRLKADLVALGQAGRMCELVERLVPDREPMIPTFELLVSSLRLLEEEKTDAGAGLWFEVNLMNQLGYRPRLQQCQVCGKGAGRMAYQPEAGGVVCGACGGQGGIAVSQGTRMLLERLLAWPPEKLGQLRLHPQLAAEAAAVMDAIIRHQLGHGLRSDVFRKAVKRLP